MVSSKVRGGQAFQKRLMGRVEVTERDQVVGQSAAFVAGPAVERGNELCLVDQAVLKREQSKKEVTVDGSGHARDSWLFRRINPRSGRHLAWQTQSRRGFFA